ncbi:MAG: hypothetical protein WC766_04765 [Patescibacteria group bacterium]|jgi:hypothetical protein
MRRAWSLLLSILLGAVVVGLGTGYFLHLANRDRQALAQEAEQAKAIASQAQQDRQSAIDEANQKLQQANGEVIKAQGIIKSLQTERDLLTKATILQPLAASVTKNWQLAVSTAQNIALKFPPGSALTQDDEQALAVSTISGATASSTTSWIKTMPFSSNKEKSLLSQISTSTEVTYLIDNNLLHGREGFLTDGSSSIKVLVLEALSNGTTTHLIWIQTPPNQKPLRNSKIITAQDVLSTFEFAKTSAVNP